jgi:hypothetical protein
MDIPEALAFLFQLISGQEQTTVGEIYRSDRSLEAKASAFLPVDLWDESSRSLGASLPIDLGATAHNGGRDLLKQV